MPHQSNVLRMLGYFSLSGLLRVHCLVGDYSTGLKSLYPLNLHITANLYTPKIIGSHITLFYYGAFAYLMLRRWGIVALPVALIKTRPEHCAYRWQ